MSTDQTRAALVRTRMDAAEASIDSLQIPADNKIVVVIVNDMPAERSLLAQEILKTFQAAFPHDPEQRPEIRIFSSPDTARKFLYYDPDRTILLVKHSFWNDGMNGLAFLAEMDRRGHLPPEGAFGIQCFVYGDGEIERRMFNRDPRALWEGQVPVAQALLDNAAVFSSRVSFLPALHGVRTELNIGTATEFVVMALRKIYMAEHVHGQDGVASIASKRPRDRGTMAGETPTVLTFPGPAPTS